jgi:UDPglucose--hexose-1-phosphate uridylyltransferase
VAIAPGRAHRPGAARAQIEPVTQEELDECPFCAGREDRTPPETLRLPEQGDWKVRVVPNLYPAVERQEVVIHSPEHKRSFAHLSDEEIELLERAWFELVVPGVNQGFAYPFWLINEGRAAGSSLPHSHSQLVFLRERPPAAPSRVDPNALEEILDRPHLFVAEDNLTQAVVHPAGRLPYELLIGGTDYLGAHLRLLRVCIQKLHALEGPVPWNAWLYLDEGAERPGYMEVVPRLTVLAGLELGAGIYVNSLDPAEAASRLRAAEPASISPS